MLAIAARNITLYARDPKHDLHLSGTNVHYGTAGAAVHIVDPVTNEYRESTAQDLYDAARLVDNLDNIHFYQRTMVCRDVTDNKDVAVDMTLTAPACPVAGEMPVMVKNALETVEGIGEVKVNMVFDPPWTPDRMSEEARLELNMF